ncbi:MAG: aminotransferase-like domain-containing protein [Alphaproteobacteria bacterium]
MTTWQPDLSSHSGPRYIAIAEALAADIATGTFEAGDRLPTHRDLAWRLGVTVGTVSRAYAEAHRRGLVSGEVGRGTYVRSVTPIVAQAMAAPGGGPGTEDSFIDMTLIFPAAGSEATAIGPTLQEMAADPATPGLLRYHSNGGLTEHRATGAEWLKRCGVETTADRVVVTAGAQHGVTVVLSSLTRPGDRILTEGVTYPGVQLVARLLGLHLDPLPLDEHGLQPDALEAACKRGNYRALYCIPTLQNPTTVTMPAERRQAIVDIARRHNLPILEDDIFRRLAPSPPPPPLCSLAPDLVYYVTGLSKTTAPGLRVGFVAAPAGAIDRLASAIRTTCWIAPPIAVEIACRWIRDGSTERILNDLRREAAWRRKRTLKALDRWKIDCAPGAMHIWLHLPEPWRSTDFAAEAKRRGLGVTPAEAFSVGRRAPSHAIRACFGSLPSRDALDKALGILTEMLEDRPLQAFGSIV